jgi:hypothetical protein
MCVQVKLFYRYRSESIELFIDDQAFSPPYDLPPPPVETQEDRERETNCGWVGGGGKIIRRRESLVLYKSFNTLWSSTAELETIMIP